MWNLYEIEKRFEQHLREIEKRSRRAHWYEKKERMGNVIKLRRRAKY